MKKTIFSLALGTFGLGMAEFGGMDHCNRARIYAVLCYLRKLRRLALAGNKYPPA